MASILTKDNSHIDDSNDISVGQPYKDSVDPGEGLRMEMYEWSPIISKLL